MSALRVGLIGFGTMGRNHARVLQSIEGVELVGVADPKIASDAPESMPVMPQPEQLLDLRPDACIVAAPTIEHEPLGLMLADAGVHALIEKPLASESKAAESLRDAFESQGLVGAVGHIERFNPALRALWQHMSAGTLGSVYQLSTERTGPFPDRVRDVGVILDLATHDLDLASWLCGAQLTSIGARTAWSGPSEHEDLVTISGMLADGTITNHLVNWVSPQKKRLVSVVGENGAFVADTLTADLTYFGNGRTPIKWETVSQLRGASEGETVRLALTKTEPLVIELEAFRDAVLGDEAHYVTMREAARVVAVAEAVAESARIGQVVAPFSSDES